MLNQMLDGREVSTQGGITPSSLLMLIRWRVWLKIVHSMFIPPKPLTNVARDRVILVYMLTKGMPVNEGEIQRQYMMNIQNNLRWQFFIGVNYSFSENS